jgi:mono/diheme cytochrome c family protein
MVVYWPRVKEILDGIMNRWTVRAKRAPYPGIHEYYWATPQDLQKSVLSGHRAIEPGVPGKETNLVRSLARGVRGTGRMPLRGPFLSQEELDEIVAWIDNGMPEGPPG